MQPTTFLLLTLMTTAPLSHLRSDKPAGFLFATFKGEQTPLTEQVYFAISRDGRRWTALNGGEAALVSKVGEKGARDPFLLRSRDGNTFYLIATDLSIHLKPDWGRAVRQGSRSILIWESPDLVNWSEPRRVAVAPEDAGCAWAPEAVVDEENGDYLVFWASTTARDNFEKHRIWAARTRDFITFSEPFIYIDKETTVIDTTIIRDGDHYYRFSKDEKYKAITMERATKLEGPWEDMPEFTLAQLVGYEGPQIYLLEPARGDVPATWCLILDYYSKGMGYQAWTTTDMASGRFEPAEDFEFPFRFRHGSVLPLTGPELRRLEAQADEPRLQTPPTPGNNPVIKGFYADPDILYSRKTGRFYLYPTTDGIPNWGGDVFKTFSSDNLVDWKEEGVILDLKTDVSWADRNAWAPCILEKETPDGFRYYFYFTAAQKIGVAVAEHPAGPFRDSGQPVCSSLPPGVPSGQTIDPAVFQDPLTGKCYLYWGNNFLAVAELSDDMLSIREDSLQVITPDESFREAITVFFREGRYYMLWSEDDTRSENYRVRYATAPSPTGPLTIPKDNLVIAKDPEAGIYATGHNTILQIPVRDEWYIVYHRFTYPDGIHMGRDAGFHRELCIDRMEFTPDGAIRRVTPTHQGIQPVQMTATTIH